jgi:hypothetical protein
MAMALVLILGLAASASGIEHQAFRMREDFGTEPLSDCMIQYYYYVPCPYYGWFWTLHGWSPGDVVGTWFKIGDTSMGGYDACDPSECHVLETIRILDYAGYGCYPQYEGLYTVEFEVYCAGEDGCPVGPAIWSSGPYETCFGWNYIQVEPPISICNCAVDPGPPPSGPRLLVTATHTGSEGYFPSWCVDNIYNTVAGGCEMHDVGCMVALYPRPYTSHYATMHSGYFGNGFEYCPPEWFKDRGDSTPDGSLYGYLELAWRIYVGCTGPTATRATTWGSVKSMYR